MPTLRRARPAAGPGRLRRNNNWLSDCSDTNGLAAYPHQTEQTQKAALQEQIEDLTKEVDALKTQRKAIKHHITIAELPEADRFKQLSTQSKHLIDTIKMVAYRAESAMAQMAREKMQALFRLVWARGQARLVTLGPRRGPTAAVETWLDGHCQRTPCGQSGDVASDRGGKPGTTLKCFSLLGRDVPRVAPGLPPLIPPLPTLRRARPAAGPGRLRRNNNWLSDCSDTNGLAAYPHQTEQTQNAS